MTDSSRVASYLAELEIALIGAMRASIDDAISEWTLL